MIEIDLHPAAAYSDDPEKRAANIDWFSMRWRQAEMGAVIQTDFCFHTKPAIGFRREPLPNNEERMRQIIGLVAKMFPDGEVAVLDAMADERVRRKRSGETPMSYSFGPNIQIDHDATDELQEYEKLDLELLARLLDQAAANAEHRQQRGGPPGIHAEDVWLAANSDKALHRHLEWNDKAAGVRWRRRQTRLLIEGLARRIDGHADAYIPRN